jgi:hypothetical protein
VLEESLAAFARFAVPALADWVAIDLAEDGGLFHRVAVAHAAPARMEAVRGPDAPPDQDPRQRRGISA